MLYSHASELAIRAALFLALQPPGRLRPVREIAHATGLSEAYLAKILHRLTTTGLVRGFRGPGRGMELARAPEEITLWMLVRATEGPEQPELCALGLQPCSAEAPCALHHKWVPLRDAIQRLLGETTLASLARAVQERTEGEENPYAPLEAEAKRNHCGERQGPKTSITKLERER